jgi:hypothetical protein
LQQQVTAKGQEVAVNSGKADDSGNVRQLVNRPSRSKAGFEWVIWKYR